MGSVLSPVVSSIIQGCHTVVGHQVLYNQTSSQQDPKIWKGQGKEYLYMKEITFLKGKIKPNYFQHQALGMPKHLRPNLNYKVSYKFESQEKLSSESK